uniref:Uncharacterized protein n=1 Tax=Nothoprocta perdicaria TaxID=30464 RepID=A0A8C7EF70_NOTPE
MGRNRGCQRGPPAVTTSSSPSYKAAARSFCLSPPSWRQEGASLGNRQDYSRAVPSATLSCAKLQLHGPSKAPPSSKGPSPPRTASHVAVDLLRLPVSAEQAPQDSHSPHPGDFLRHASVGQPALTDAHVPALAAGQGVLPAAGPRVHGHGLADDQAILDELPDLLA